MLYHNTIDQCEPIRKVKTLNKLFYVFFFHFDKMSEKIMTFFVLKFVTIVEFKFLKSYSYYHKIVLI